MAKMNTICLQKEMELNPAIYVQCKLQHDLRRKKPNQPLFILSVFENSPFLQKAFFSILFSLLPYACNFYTP